MTRSALSRYSYSRSTIGNSSEGCGRKREWPAIISSYSPCHHPHFKSESATQCDDLTKDIAVRDCHVIAHVMGHECIPRTTKVGGHEGPLASRPAPPVFSDGF